MKSFEFIGQKSPKNRARQAQAELTCRPGQRAALAGQASAGLAGGERNVVELLRWPNPERVPPDLSGLEAAQLERIPVSISVAHLKFAKILRESRTR